MFEDSDFEIYESTTKTYAINEIHEIIESFSKHVLKMKKVLNNIKVRFYEIAETMKNNQ